MLVDNYNRHIHYLRLSVTDRCDLRCTYCLPEQYSDFEEPSNWLSFDEIEELIRAFASVGVAKIRITGGEPLTRKNIDQLIPRLARINGIDDLSMSTNATRLDKLAAPLADAGISRINVSLDTLKPQRFKDITKGKLDKVITGLMAAKAAKLHPIKINMVVMKGVNDDEAEDMVDFCMEHNFTLRFIETMPVGDTGRSAFDQYINLDEIKRRLSSKYELLPAHLGRGMQGAGPAKYWQIAGSDTTIGFITPISQHFCETCNRVRLSADGVLHMCLGQEHSFDFKPLLQANASQAELQDAIRHAINLKPERHEFTEKPDQVIRFMAKTGG